MSRNLPTVSSGCSEDVLRMFGENLSWYPDFIMIVIQCIDMAQRYCLGSVWLYIALGGCKSLRIIKDKCPDDIARMFGGFGGCSEKFVMVS